LETYRRTVPDAKSVRHASIFALPFENHTFDGIYNLGVMEHFQAEEITAILREFRRVLKPEGRLLMFWPHARATSVAVLGCWQKIRKKFFGSEKLLHPAEVSLVRSRKWLAGTLETGGFHLESSAFDWRDFWVQVVVIAHPQISANPDRGAPSPPPFR
jgi:predicted SAM-dependent methyltransferase